MRINGFEQIKAFYSWVFNSPDKVRTTHIALYSFLWNQGNRANWVEWFKCPYDLAMQGACIGNKGTYYRCLDDLQNFGLIKYKKGVNNYKAPQIHLIKLYDSEHLSEQVTVPLSEHLTAPIYKLLTNNLKLITDNLEKVIDFLNSDEIETKNTLTESERDLRFKNLLQDEHQKWFRLNKWKTEITSLEKLVELWKQHSYSKKFTGAMHFVNAFNKWAKENYVKEQKVDYSMGTLADGTPNEW